MSQRRDKSFTVQSSYKLNIPEHLIIHAANIELCEAIGQGNYCISIDTNHYKYFHAIWMTDDNHNYYIIIYSQLYSCIVFYLYIQDLRS